MKQRSIKKLATVLMLVSFIFATVSPAMAGGLAKITDFVGGNGGNAKGNAETIYFGNYWQNGSGSALSGYTKSGIKWRVLATDAPLNPDGSANTGVLLLSDQGLYADQFNSNKSMGNKWSTSEIRATLTGLNSEVSSADKKYADLNTTSFAYDAFNAKEYAAIADTTHTAGGPSANSTVSSTDKIFLLSADEAQNTSYGFTDNAQRKASATVMAKNVTMYSNSKTVKVDSNGIFLWLRSTGNTASKASNIGSSGNVSIYPDVSDDANAARPALNLNQNSVLFASAATGGKGNVNVGNGFALADYDGSNGWKLTLLDAYNATTNTGGIKAPTNVTITQKLNGDLNSTSAAAAAGSGIMDLTNGYQAQYGNAVISYTAEAITEGNANYVSAVAKDGSGSLLNYAKISGQAAESAKELNVDNLSEGDEIYIYAEQANGEYETDYASELSAGYTIRKGAGQKYEGVLAKDYADKGLTANLGSGFKLGFENAKYDTKVNVGAGNGEVSGGTTIAELNANENTTVTGFVNATTATIATDKQITTNGAFVSDKFVAIGQGAVVKAAATNSVALGNGSVADAADTISVGSSTQTRSISNVTAVTPASGGTYAATTGQVYNATISGVTLTTNASGKNSNLTVAENGSSKSVDLYGLITEQGTNNATAISGIASNITFTADGKYYCSSDTAAAALGKVDAQVFGNASNITELQGTVSGINTNVTTLTTKVGSVEAGNYTDASKSLGYNIGLLDTQVKTNADAISGNAANITTLQGQMETAEGKIDDHGERLGTAEGNISNLQTTVNNITSGSGEVKTQTVETKEFAVKNADGTATTTINENGITTNSVKVGGNTITNEGIKLGNTVNITEQGIKLGNTVNITEQGINAGTTQITNVKSGGDLVSGGTNAANIGDVYKATTMMTGGNYYEGGDSVTNAVSEVDAQVKTNTDAIAAITSGSGEVKTQTVETKEFAVKNADGTATTTINENGVTTNSVTVGGNTITNEGIKVGNTVNITEQGINAGTTQITNVKSAGTISENNTNAVNGADLYGEVRPADGNYLQKNNTTAKNLEVLDGRIGKLQSGGILEGGTVAKDLQNLETAINNIEAGEINMVKGQKKNTADKAAKADVGGTTAVGYNAAAGSEGATAVGYGNIAKGERSTAVGYKNNVSGDRSGAFGDPNTVTGSGSYAFGNMNTIAQDSTFVLGNNVTTTQANSVVLGNKSTDRAPEGEAVGVVSVGSETERRQIINVADGTQATDAATVGQVDRAFANVQNQLGTVSNEVKEVGAMSAALAGLHYVEPSGEEGDKFVGAVAYGNYRGESAGAIGVAYKPNPNFMFSASTSVGQNQNAYNAGMSLKFGKGETAQTRAELKKQVEYLNERNQAQDEKITAQDEKIMRLENDKAAQGAEIQSLKGEIEELKKLIKK